MSSRMDGTCLIRIWREINAEQNGWKIFRVTQGKPLESVETQILFAAASKHLQAGGRVHVWFSLPCTAWSSWQRINKAKAEDHTMIKGKENESLFLQQLFRSYGFQVIKEGGEISFEWPAFCDGWKCDIVSEFVDMEGTHTAICHGCMFGLTTKATGAPMKKPFKIATTVQKLAIEAFGKVRLRQEPLPCSYARCGHSSNRELHFTDLYSGQDKDGYTVDAVCTTSWMDVVETDFQRKLRACENHASCYSDLVKQSPQWMEPLGEINTLYDEQGRVSINVTTHERASRSGSA
eukprot:1042277-Amphidinium_carterae.1